MEALRLVFKLASKLSEAFLMPLEDALCDGLKLGLESLACRLCIGGVFLPLYLEYFFSRILGYTSVICLCGCFSSNVDVVLSVGSELKTLPEIWLLLVEDLTFSWDEWLSTSSMLVLGG